MTWSNIINKVDKEKRPWAKRSTQHLLNESPSQWRADCQHDDRGGCPYQKDLGNY